MSWEEKTRRFYQQQAPGLAFLALIGWAVCVRWLGVHPPAGTHVAVLGFLVAIVTIWPPETRLGKAAWVMVFFGLSVLEITGLYRDSKELAEAREKETKTFSALLDREKEIVGQVTGDDGFVYLDVVLVPVDAGGASLAATVNGEYAIRQVMYDLIEGLPRIPTDRENNEFLSGRHLNVTIGDMPPHLLRVLGSPPSTA